MTGQKRGGGEVEIENQRPFTGGCFEVRSCLSGREHRCCELVQLTRRTCCLVCPPATSPREEHLVANRLQRTHGNLQVACSRSANKSEKLHPREPLQNVAWPDSLPHVLRRLSFVARSWPPRRSARVLPSAPHQEILVFRSSPKVELNPKTLCGALVRGVSSSMKCWGVPRTNTSRQAAFEGRRHGGHRISPPHYPLVPASSDGNRYRLAPSSGPGSASKTSRDTFVKALAERMGYH